MTSLGVFTTGTPGFAALDHAFGQRASAHGLCFSQFGGELAITGGRRLIVHAPSCSYVSRKVNRNIPLFMPIALLVMCAPSRPGCCA
jgi:hypothetical protein